MLPAPSRSRDARLCWLAAALLPPALSMALGSLSSAGAWWMAAPPLAREALAGLLLAGNTLAILAGCAIAEPGGRAWAAAAIALGSSVITVGLVAGSSWDAWATAHAVLAGAILATASTRALAGRLLQEPLDAAATTGLLLVGATGGLLLVGPALEEIPRAAVNTLLAVNPVIAVTTAAGIDPLRTDILYRTSPVAHLDFVYPGVIGTLVLHAGVATACIAGCILRPSRLRSSR